MATGMAPLLFGLTLFGKESRAILRGLLERSYTAEQLPG